MKSRHLLWLSLLPLLIFVSCVRPSPAIAISTYHQYYSIEGNSAQELRRQMGRLGPRDESGQHLDAYTDWYITWSYPYSSDGEACRPGPVDVQVSITFILPQWDIPSNASPALIDRWQTYLGALQAHEEGHQEIAEQAAQEILHALEGLGEFPTCEELEHAADELGESILGEYRHREVLYDSDTSHGRTQGAVFP